MLTRFWALLKEMVSEQYEYRELLYQMTMRDLRIRYKQSIMGFGWAIFMPLVNTILFSVIFTRVAPIETPVAYPLFAFCGVWAWNLLAGSLKFAVHSLTSNVNLVTKIYFPREIFPVSAVLVCLIDTLVAATVLVGLMVWYGVTPSVTILLVPVVLLVHLTLTVALAMILAMSNLFFRDVKYIFEVVITLGMFTTSAVYPIDTIGGRLGTLIRLNPVTGIIEAYRSTLLYGQLPDVSFVWAAVISIVMVGGAWIIFHRSEFKFAESV